MSPSGLRERLYRWLAERLFAAARWLDQSYDVWLDDAPRRRCEICHKTGRLDYRGWTDDGDPMLTCVQCGSPETRAAVS